MSAPQWDAIVIGSGIGGMSAATLLAKVGGLKVLVLEKHSERGGLTHVFRRDGASWDVGVHYLGNMFEGSPIRTLYDFMSGKALEWNHMPDDFERFIYPGLDFAVPSDPKRYEERLIQRFPDEAKAIRRYFVDLDNAAGWHVQGTAKDILPWPINALVGLWRRLGSKNGMQTTGEYLDHHFKSLELKALLASQWADYGLPPSESAFALHALVVRSYFQGGWFPDKGASRIARTFEVGVEENGGAIKVCQEVTQILTEGTRVVGVKALNGQRPEPIEVEYRAPIVISDAGAITTFNHLLPTEGAIGRLTAKVRHDIDLLDNGLSGVVLYLRLAKPASTLGVKGENYWIKTNFQHDNIDEQTEAVLAGKPQYAYMSFPSAKSGDPRFHTVEVLALVRSEAFHTWSKTTHGTRGQEYLELKTRITNGLLDLADSATPGLKALVQYSELSTPLSMYDFTSHPGGTIYGLKGIPKRYASPSLTAAPSIAGLHLSGADVSSLGISGAMIGGVLAASRVLGPLGFIKIMMAARKVEPITEIPLTAAIRSPEKKRATLLSKAALTPFIWKLDFELPEPVDFAPGQFAMLRVAPWEWRNYSIASVEAKRLSLLISTRTGGDGSLFAANVQLGSETEIELPFGSFQLQRNSHRTVFVATGTGLAPFLPMFEELEAAGKLHLAELLFGCSYAGDDITGGLKSLPRTTVCVSRDTSVEGSFHGRVTEVLKGMKFDPSSTDFYLCGAPAMIDDSRTILAQAGAMQVLVEPF